MSHSRREFLIGGTGLVVAGVAQELLPRAEAAVEDMRSAEMHDFASKLVAALGTRSRIRKAEAAPLAQTFERVTLEGFPSSVGKTLSVPRARAEYGYKGDNTVGLGTDRYVGTEGVLLFQMQTPENIAAAQKNGGNRWREWFLAPATADVITDEQGEWRAGEGRWARISFGGGTVEADAIGGSVLRGRFGFSETVHHNLWVRGLSPDGNTPRDRNQQIRMNNLVGGNVYVEQYPSGSFISEGYWKQLLESEFAGGGNPNGREGSREVYNTYWDLNTKAVVVTVHTGPNPAQGRLVYAN
jgi:hypothetical protein